MDGRTGEVTAMISNANGKRIVSAASKHIMLGWDAENVMIERHNMARRLVHRIAVSADGNEAVLV